MKTKNILRSVLPILLALVGISLISFSLFYLLPQALESSEAQGSVPFQQVIK